MKKVLVLLLVVLTGCITAQKPPVNPDPYDLQFDLSYTNGLSHKDRAVYYYMDEGIQYLPADVLASLNRPIEEGLGMYNERILARPERFGLYPNPYNKQLMPIGITASKDTSFVPMAGINCATCHTSVISSNGKAFLVDGGSGLFAIDRLIKEMVFAMAATMASPSEFSKFYRRYQAKAGFAMSANDQKQLDSMVDDPSYVQLNSALHKHLRGQNTHLDKDLMKYITVNSPKLAIKNSTLSGAYPTRDQLSSGPKMFLYLAKRLLFFYQQGSYASVPDGSTVGDNGLGRANPWAVVKNMLAKNLEGADELPKIPGGPINTPVIWQFDRAKWIFWTGVTNSMLERNMAQGVALVTDFNWETYETTVSIKKLHQVSGYAKKSTPPVWPEHILGTINRTQAELGKELYKNHCLGCHTDSKNVSTASFSYKYLDVGTDPEYYRGQVESFYGKDLFKDVLAPWLNKIKTAAYKREKISNPSLYEAGRTDIVWQAPTGNKPEARPLYGIWASAPYLHNGSVPSIRDLLKKPSERTKEFYVGSTEYDPVNLGFKSQDLYFAFKLQTKCDKCTGNSNQGHDFGTCLTDAEKDQLIEFLKSYTTETQF